MSVSLDEAGTVCISEGTPSVGESTCSLWFKAYTGHT